MIKILKSSEKRSNKIKTGQSKKFTHPLKQKGIPHLQSEAIPESAWNQDYHGPDRDQQQLVNPKIGISIRQNAELIKDRTNRQRLLETDPRHEIFVFCIVHSYVITCIPSSKTLPPGRLLNFTEIHW